MPVLIKAPHKKVHTNPSLVIGEVYKVIFGDKHVGRLFTCTRDAYTSFTRLTLVWLDTPGFDTVAVICDYSLGYEITTLQEV